LEQPSPYDHTIYNSEPVKLAHPVHIGTIARFYGVTSQVPAKSRILEIGCGTGMNCIALAVSFPGADIIGIDLSREQIRLGQNTLQELDLKNIQLFQKDLLDQDFNFGNFDYIICHGVLSWVSEAVRKEILYIFKKFLSSNGVGFVSYNTYPGWKLRGLVREVFLTIKEMTLTEEETLHKTRSLLNILLTEVITEDGDDTTLLKKEIHRILSFPDWYLTHDLLAQYNNPFSFKCFYNELVEHELLYLCDADPIKNAPLSLGQKAQNFLSKIQSLQEFETMYDLFCTRMFRRSIVCKREALQLASKEIKATNFKHIHQIPSSVIKNLYFGFYLKREHQDNIGKTVFKDPRNGGKIATASPVLIGLIKKISSSYPQMLLTSELLQEFVKEHNNALSKEQIENEFSDFFNLTYFSGIISCSSFDLSELYTCYIDTDSNPFTNLETLFYICPFVIYTVNKGIQSYDRHLERIDLSAEQLQVISVMHQKKPLSELEELWNSIKSPFNREFKEIFNELVKLRIVLRENT
jgi:SAM-dependent methyltransferase